MLYVLVLGGTQIIQKYYMNANMSAQIFIVPEEQIVFET